MLLATVNIYVLYHCTQLYIHELHLVNQIYNGNSTLSIDVIQIPSVESYDVQTPWRDSPGYGQEQSNT